MFIIKEMKHARIYETEFYFSILFNVIKNEVARNGFKLS